MTKIIDEIMYVRKVTTNPTTSFVLLILEEKSFLNIRSSATVSLFTYVSVYFVQSIPTHGTTSILSHY